MEFFETKYHLNPKAKKATKLILSILCLGVLVAILYLLIFVIKTSITLQAPEGPFSTTTQTSGVTFEVTAYCPCELCCGKWADGITASGEYAEGFFVAAPPEYPFKTLMAVPGYNEGKPVEVLDRGGAIKGNKLDVFFPTHQEAKNWGRQKLKVRIVK